MAALLSLGIAVCALVAFFNWRLGLLLVVVTALLQDPLRKLIPGQPVYFIALVVLVLALAIVGALLRGVPFSLGRIAHWRRSLSAPFVAYVILVGIQAVHSYAVHLNPLLTGIGLITYLAPIPAILIGHRFALAAGPRGVVRWYGFYALAVGLALTTVLMEHLGIDSEMFGQVGSGMAIFDLGTILWGSSGIFRSTEVAAWHVATVSSIVFLLFTARGLEFRRVAPAVVLVLGLVAIGIVTGRRKMLMEVSIFLVAYMSLLTFYGLGGVKLAIGILVAGGISFAYLFGFDGQQGTALDGAPSEYELFLKRGTTVIGDAPERATGVGVGSISWAIREHGFLGSGIGVATSGAQHAAGSGGVLAGTGEAGPGKIISELGLPGMAIILWGLMAMLRHIHWLLGYVAQRSLALARVSCALTALLIANAAVYFVATQVFSDLFVLIFIGLTLGFLLAMPDLAVRAVAARSARRPAGSRTVAYGRP